jgi:hydroxyethylthiazole kinase
VLIEASHCADQLDRIRCGMPRVHCVINDVAAAFTANVLLALGAVPSMSSAPDEVAHFVSSAGALCVNLGTLNAERVLGIGRAVSSAREADLPWVLDPVFVQRSPPRLDFARKLLALKPAVVRGNREEIDALFAGSQASDSGTDRAVWQSAAEDSVHVAGLRYSVANGHLLMGRVTGVGCAAGALVAAFLAVGSTPGQAAIGAALSMGIAGERAGELARGPGQFQIALLDQLYQLESSAFDAARFEPRRLGV